MVRLSDHPAGFLLETTYDFADHSTSNSAIERLWQQPLADTFARATAQYIRVILHFGIPSLVAFTCCLGQLTHAQRSEQSIAAGPVIIRSAEDVVRSWSSGHHLYVKGDVGVGANQLSELKSWLAEHGPHWTVVLMQQASEESYVGKDGRHYTGLDAVEYALGYGLSNRSAFGSLQHPTTKETDGTVLVIFLRERKFSYFASDAQDRRNLGEANWVGELDQPAFQAMRSGGRIIDAVKNTVQSVNARLARAIQAETDAAQRAERELQRAAIEFRARLVDTRQSIDKVIAQAAEFRSSAPNASGPLTAPPVDDWRRTLAEVESEISADSVRTLEQRHAIILDEVVRYLNEYAAIQGLAPHRASLEQRLVSLQTQPSSVVSSQIDRADAIMAKAIQAARDGSLNVSELLTEVDTAAADAEQLAQAEQRRSELLRLRSRWIRITIATMATIAGLIASGILWMLNRRRRPSMLRAVQEYDRSEASVRGETDNLDKLFTRCSDLLGSREKIDQRGYVGATREVALQALGHVDELFILSKEVKRVLEEARQLIYPRNPLGRVMNLFSSARFEQAINHVSGKPLRFSTTSGLPTVIRQRLRHAASTQPSGSESPQELTLTFEDAYTAFKQCGDQAEAALDEFESSLAGVHDVLASLQTKFEALTAQEKQLQQAAEHDGYLTVPNYFDVLIPSIQTDLNSADQMATFDAVEAMRGPITAAQRKIDEAASLGAQLAAARDKVFPVLHQCASQLKSLGYTSDWIDAHLDAITERANGLLKLTVGESIKDRIETLATDLKAIGSRAELTLNLATQIENQLSAELKEQATKISQTRHTLAGRLKLPDSAIMHEADRDPDETLASARQSMVAARTMLAYGRTESATEAIDTCTSESKRVSQILELSVAACQSYDQRRGTLQQSLEPMTIHAERTSGEIEQARQVYARSVLIIDTASRPEPAEDGVRVVDASLANNVDQLLQDAHRLVKQTRQSLDLAEVDFRAGRLLTSADRLTTCEQGLTAARGNLDCIAEHLARIERQVRENQSAHQRCQSTFERLQLEARNPMVREQTLVAIEQAQNEVDRSGREIEFARGQSDPFGAAQAIARVAKLLEELQSRVISDAQAHAEASRAVVGAQRQMDAALQFVRQSQTDNIADSPLTSQLHQRIAELQGELASIEQELKIPHGDWQWVDDRASRLQSEISTAAKTLSQEMQAAGQALLSFQQAAKSVYQAEQWSGSWGIRVPGSPGVGELERARSSLQQGNYNSVLELSRLAAAAAMLAIQQAEREVARRRMEEQLAAERARRAREASMRPPTVNFPLGGGSRSGLGSCTGGFFSGGSRDSSDSSGSGGNTSGFRRSGW